MLTSILTFKAFRAFGTPEKPGKGKNKPFSGIKSGCRPIKKSVSSY